jgi:cellulose synthase/poly-beta-1,6-N-acetylglucosamine synthase-like glycosyltransferase
MVGTALAAALPWILAPAVLVWRVRGAPELEAHDAAPPADPPLLSVIIPARDERRNIEPCVRSALASAWPRLEVVVVDDGSTDGTGDLARRLAAEDPRVRVVDTPPLPAGWFGKPWACTTGARAARGELLCFVDADTRQAPDLLPRAVAAMRAHDAGLLSVAGDQELGTLWERLVQPQVFTTIASRYGGVRQINESRRVWDKIANGQCILVRRDAYERAGGHAAVRDKVAEDLAIAQRFFVAGLRPTLVMGRAQLTTRMYTSLAELVRGWRKNIVAGSRDALPPFPGVGLLHPISVLLPPLFNLTPAAALALGAAGVGPAWLGLAGLIAYVSFSLWWALVSRWHGVPAWYGVLHPLGAAVFLYIAAGAVLRGRRVAWKGREYRAG